MAWPLSVVPLSVISFYQLFAIPVHFSKSRKFLTDLLLKNPESFPVKSFKYLKYFSNHGRKRARRDARIASEMNVNLPFLELRRCG